MSPWNDITEARLRKMAKDGASASEIGAAIGVSRNAVIGKAGRMGVRLMHGKTVAPSKRKRISGWHKIRAGTFQNDAPWAGPPIVVHHDTSVLPFKNNDREIREFLAAIDRRDSARAGGTR